MKIFVALVIFFFVNFNSLSKAEILVSNQAPCQGETVEVTLSSPSFAFNGKKVPTFEKGEAFADHPRSGGLEGSEGTKNGAATNSDTNATKTRYRALFAIPADLEPGRYPIKSEGEVKTLSVSKGPFVLQRFSLPKSKDNFEMSAGEKEAIEGAKATVTAEQFWTGKFQRPSIARVSGTFGTKRVVNGRLLKDYFHSGIDYAGSLGSPITACADGKVLVTGHNFRLHGNCVCLDHGQGVISIYIHMQKILVTQGQTVHKGELIGRVGQSGRATGPHLHFSLYVNETAANPNDWYQKIF